ncbi:hypothetical protein HYZ97_04265 [Candidatus Pacearchaeota archaeon]|nr:hypothetical protein [Candidatus Pacearchaeota archaeon]
MAYKMIRMRDKNGQAALWVIVALAFVVLIGLLMFIRQKPGPITLEENYNPQAFIDRCVRDAVQEEVDVLLPRGGFREPKSSLAYKNVSITYLCMNTGYFAPCINQHPLYIEEVKQELYTNTYEKIDSCFTELETALEQRNQEVSFGELGVSFDLAPQRILVSLERDMQIQGREGSETLSTFQILIQSPFYDLASVAVEIASQEASYCYFEYAGYSLLHPETEIRKTTLSDSTKLYFIRDVYSQKELTIAVRGCAIPPGV